MTQDTPSGSGQGKAFQTTSAIIQPGMQKEAATKKVTVAGETLVEVMADTTGDGFREPSALSGPEIV